MRTLLFPVFVTRQFFNPCNPQDPQVRKAQLKFQMKNGKNKSTAVGMTNTKKPILQSTSSPIPPCTGSTLRWASPPMTRKWKWKCQTTEFVVNSALNIYTPIHISYHILHCLSTCLPYCLHIILCLSPTNLLTYIPTLLLIYLPADLFTHSIHASSQTKF